MGHANVGITQGVYTHLFGREKAEQTFREKMSGGASVGKSLASNDPEQPGTTETPTQATKPNTD